MVAFAGAGVQMQEKSKVVDFSHLIGKRAKITGAQLGEHRIAYAFGNVMAVSSANNTLLTVRFLFGDSLLDGTIVESGLHAEINHGSVGKVDAWQMCLSCQKTTKDCQCTMEKAKAHARRQPHRMTRKKLRKHLLASLPPMVERK